MEGVCGGSGACLYTSSFTVRCVLDLDIHLIQAIITVVFVNMNLGYGTLQCYPGVGSCPGAQNSNCYPNHIWSGEYRDTGYYSGFQLNGGTLYREGTCDSTGKCIYTHAFTVRCVLDLNFQSER